MKYLKFLYLKVVRQSNWLPDSATPAAGKEVEKLSFLGPFLALSVFAEDNVSISYRGKQSCSVE